MKMMLRKTLALVLAILMVVGMFPLHQAQEAFAASTKTYYLKTNSNWEADGARFAVYYYDNGGANSGWVSMTKVSTHLYSANVPVRQNLIFTRMNGSTTANNWNNKWNQTGDLTWQSTNNCFTLPSSVSDGGTSGWGVYTPPATTYNVTYSGSNITCFGNSTVTAGTAYSATLSAATGYELPNTITVTVGGTVLTSGYTYDKSTGKVSIEAAKVTGNINIKADGVKIQVEEPDTITLYLDPGVWAVDGPPYALHYWYSGQSGVDVSMTEKDGIYYAEIPADADYVIFQRANWTKKTNNLEIPNDGKNMYTITGWDNGSNNICPGTWSTYGGGGEEKDDYYVNTDIVDYLNDSRVNFGNVNGYSGDNQGNWMVEDAGNPVFSYLNHIISANAVDSEGNTKYSYPLYFGNLLFISSRYGTTYKAFSNIDEYKNNRNGNQISLNNWNTGANVALPNTLDAVVQGLVGSELDEYGQLVDPVTGKQLFYFDKTSIESWKTSDDANGKRLMAYYSNLQFPFKTTYNADTGVTTYSYDSTKDTAVYIDYDNYDSAAKTNPMKTGSFTKDYNNNRGFFPLNKPGESGDASNYGFGVKFTIDFTVSKDGKIVSADGTETPVEFSFTGDDDVWVFIDGKLVLDMGGAHALAHGSINFQTLSATVKNAAQVSTTIKNPSHYYNSYGYKRDGEQREELTIEGTKTTAFPEELAKVFQNEYNTGMSQVHTLTMFYMERAGYESNMSIEFSMSPIPTGLTISKDIENVNPGLNDDVQADDEFSFVVDATNGNDKVVFDGYDLTDHGSVTTDGVVTDGNIISGIRGDRYAHSFTNGNKGAFSAGTSFKITETNFDRTKYYSTRWVLYEYSNGYKELKRGEGVEAAFDTLVNSSGNYALNFINAIRTNTLVIKKEYPDTLINTSNMQFTFEILLDVDGTDYQLQPGLTYDLYNGTTLVSENLISEDGRIKLKAGQTVKINGIPVGTNYKVVEVDDSNLWETVGSGTITGTMENAEVTYTFTNKTSTTDLDKVIYVEAGTDTYYAIADGKNAITLNSVYDIDNGLKASISNGKILVNATNTNTVYTFEYSGTYPDGSFVSGTVTVYTYSATVKNYVFDFGLSSDLEKGDYGLFQGGVFDNQFALEESAILKSLIGVGNTQTTITTTLGGTIGSNNRYGKEIIFTPVAIMDKIEYYNYTVQITAKGKTFDPSNPETGCIVTGTIRVMPANTVYYEEFFDYGDTIIFSKDVTLTAPDKELTQDNSSSDAYGYDSAYNGFYQNSNNSVAVMNHLDYAYFTFTGTGFDLISQTNATSAGLAVYVFEGQHSEANLKYVTDLEDNGVTPKDMVFVHTYYANGSLYQVPVIDVRLDKYATYTVYVQCLSTFNGSSIALDGIRIYNPLKDTQYYGSSEQNVIFSELRQLMNSDKSNQINDSKDILQLAGMVNGSLFVGTGKQSVVAQALIENPELGTNIITSADLKTVYQQGPNNEMYLPKNLGVMFTYSVSGPVWTLQLGAKAVTATNEAKSVSVYVRASGSDSAEKVADITLSTTTDMYYDLSTYLGKYAEQGKTYELFIISNSEASNNEFVSLTSIKHAGLKLGGES